MIFFNWTKYLVKGAKGFRSFFFWFGWRHMDVGWGGPAVFESLSTHPVRPIRQSHTSLSSSSFSPFLLQESSPLACPTRSPTACSPARPCTKLAGAAHSPMRLLGCLTAQPARSLPMPPPSCSTPSVLILSALQAAAGVYLCMLWQTHYLRKKVNKEQNSLAQQGCKGETLSHP